MEFNKLTHPLSMKMGRGRIGISVKNQASKFRNGIVPIKNNMKHKKGFQFWNPFFYNILG